MGGGIVIMPMLAQFTSMSAHRIVGTSLMSVSLAASVGACSYASQGLGDVPTAALMAVSSFMTGKVGVYVGSRISGSTLKRTMGCALILFVPLVLAKARTGDVETKTKESEDVHEMTSSLYDFVISKGDYVGVGLLSGFAAGLLGLGGGIVSTTYMSGYVVHGERREQTPSLLAHRRTKFTARFELQNERHATSRGCGDVSNRFGSDRSVREHMAPSRRQRVLTKRGHDLRMLRRRHVLCQRVRRARCRRREYA